MNARLEGELVGYVRPQFRRSGGSGPRALPMGSLFRWSWGTTYSLKKLHREALRDREFARTGIPIGLDLIFDKFIACAYARAGRADKALETFQYRDEISSDQPGDPVSCAAVYLSLHDP